MSIYDTCRNSDCPKPVFADAHYCSAWCMDAHTKYVVEAEAFVASTTTRQEWTTGLRARLGLA